MDTVFSSIAPKVINDGFIPVCAGTYRVQSRKKELVTITLTQEDYEKLKAAGGHLQSQVERALGNYLKARRHLQVTNLGWQRGPVMSFLCAIPKNLSNQIRNLSGRFDSHTILAFRMYLL